MYKNRSNIHSFLSNFDFPIASLAAILNDVIKYFWAQWEFIIRPGGVPRTLLDMPDVSDCLQQRIAI